MTEHKRFELEYVRGKPNFWDNVVDLADCYLTCEDVVDLLNDLSEENEQLKDALNQRTDQCDNYYKENEQLYELIDFANTLIAFKTSESCQAEWAKRLKELKGE